MIVRLWRGRVAAARAAEYAAYQSEVGPPGYRVVPGNRGIFMLGRELGDQYEIAMLTLWESWSAIRRFAGEPVDRARYYARDFDFLIDPPETVEHFELVARRGGRGEARALRWWQRSVGAARQAEALRRELETRLPEVLGAAGNRGALLLARELAGRREIVRVTLWDGPLAASRAGSDGEGGEEFEVLEADGFGAPAQLASDAGSTASRK